MLIGTISCLSVLAAVLLCVGTGAFCNLHWLWMLPTGLLGSFILLAGLAFAILLIACAVVDPDKQYEKDSHTDIEGDVPFQIASCYGQRGNQGCHTEDQHGVEYIGSDDVAYGHVRLALECRQETYHHFRGGCTNAHDGQSDIHYDCITA